MAKMKKAKPVRKETPEQLAKRLERNKKARARHWHNTGVSDRTVRWMDDMGML